MRVLSHIWYTPLVIIGLLFSLQVTQAESGVTVPRSLSIVACETNEFITILRGANVLRVPIEKLMWADKIIKPQVHNWRDLEWRIEGGKIDCKHEIIDLTDLAELKGMPGMDEDFSRHLICNLAAASYTPTWNDRNHGWAVMAIGCPKPLFSDNGTPDDLSDDRIVGYAMPSCPSEINNILIKCLFSENEI